MSDKSGSNVTSTTKPFRVGVICGGDRGWQLQVPVAATLARLTWDIELAAVADRDRGRADRFADVLGGAALFASPEEMFERAELHGVIVAASPEEQMRETVTAFGHGLHVLCDEPFGTSAEEARRMIAAADRAGRVLADGYLSPLQAEWAVRRIREGDVGELRGIAVRWFRSRYDYRRGVVDSPDFWHLHGRSARTGPAGSLLAVIVPLLGSPVVAVRAIADSSALLLELESGSEVGVRLAASRGKYPDTHAFDLRCQGTEGELQVPLADSWFNSGRLSQLVAPRAWWQTDEVMRRIEDTVLGCQRNWVRASLGLEELRSRPEGALAVHAVLDGSRQSLFRGGGERVDV